MQKIWKVLNSPLIVVLIALAIWPYFAILPAKLGVDSSYEEAKGRKHSSDLNLKNGLSVEETEALMAQVKTENVRLVTASLSSQNVIGSVHNTSDKIITEIVLTISFYDESGELMDVKVENLRNIQFLRPGDSIDFSEKRFFNKEKDSPASSVFVRLTSLGIVKSSPEDAEE